MATQDELLDQDKLYQASVAVQQSNFQLAATDSALPLPTTAEQIKIALTKGSAGAYTLAAPTAAMNGKELIIVAGTAFAHVITATNLLDDGVTGGAKDTATFAAFVGSGIHLMAYNLKWCVVAKNLVTIAAV
jgi:D-ribose pyranose/furanose isomerase RbsD